MSTKRAAEKELNADNWEEVDGPEEPGLYKVASQEILRSRIIKTAKRRVHNQDDDEPKKGIFSGFGGFNKTPSSNSASPFGFLSKPSNGSANQPAVDLGNNFMTAGTSETKKLEIKTKEQDISNLTPKIINKTPPLSIHSDEYCANLKNLNLGVCEWIKSHIDKNPYCILTPIFDDYNKYLNDINKTKTDSPSNPMSTKTLSDNVSPVVSMNEKALNNPNRTGSIFESSRVGEWKSSTSTKTVHVESPNTSKADKTDNKLVNPTSLFNQGFASTPVSKAPMFSFGQSSKTPTETVASNFSFGTGKPFSFGNIAHSEVKAATKPEDENEDDEEPPKVDFTPVVEEGSIFSKRCKVFVKKDGSFGDRGVGTMFLKPISSSEKYQLIVRADTSLGNLLLNLVLSESIPTQRVGKNNVMLMCIPTPDSPSTPVSVLLRVKTSDEANELLDTLNKYKK